MDYLTVKEVAELKGCSERYIKKVIKDGKMEAVTEQNEKNRPKYHIPVSALPEELKARYYKRKQQELQQYSCGSCGFQVLFRRVCDEEICNKCFG